MVARISRTRKFAFAALTGLCLILFGLSACGDATATMAPASTTAPAAAATTAPASSMMDSAAGSTNSEAGKNNPSAAQAPAAAATVPATGSGSKPAAVDRKVMRNAAVTLSVAPDAVQPAVNTVSGYVTNAGGYLLQSNNVQREGYLYATMTFQVPFAQFENVLSQLRMLPGKTGRVESEQTSGQDVTEEFTDTESEIRNLQTQEQSLLRLLDKATKLEDIITIQNKLAEVRGQIEKMQGRIKFLTNRTDYSTVTLTINPIIPPAPTATPAPTPSSNIEFDGGKVSSQAWHASLNVLKIAATVVISVIVFGWWLIPVLLVGGLLYRRNRSMRRAVMPTPVPHDAPLSEPEREKVGAADSGTKWPLG